MAYANGPVFTPALNRTFERLPDGALEHATERAVFLDKDGTVLDDVPYNIDPRKMRFAPGAQAALEQLAASRYKLIVVSNQGGVAQGRFPIEALDAVDERLRAMFASCGATLDAFYWCPHDPRGQVAPYASACECRKPAPGMLLQAAREHRIDLRGSWMVGDILDDVEAGNRAGCRTILLDNGNETEWRAGPWRSPGAYARDLQIAARIIAGEHEYAHERGHEPATAGASHAAAATRHRKREATS
jgi:D-glycero-D-manno-heptose 1,7-bisphosphate phosphatase